MDLLCFPGGLSPSLPPLPAAADRRFQVSQKDWDTARVKEVEETPQPPHRVRWQEQQAPAQLPSTSSSVTLLARRQCKKEELYELTFPSPGRKEVVDSMLTG